MARKFVASRVTLAVALAAGLTFAAASPALAAKKEKVAAAVFSDAFRKVAAPIEKVVSGAMAKLPSPAGPADYAKAKTEIDAGLGGDGKAAFLAAIPAATTPDDKQVLGTMIRNFGILSQDLALKQQGNALLLESGRLPMAGTAPAQSVGSISFDAGITAYQMKDWATAAQYFKGAKDAGYVDPNGQLDVLLIDAYKRSGNTQAVIEVSRAEVAAAQARGVAPSESALRQLLQASYDARQLAPSVDYASMLGQYYPATWGVAINVVAQLAALPREIDVDLMRLKFLTKGMTDKRDYFLYLEAVDPRAFPGEALKVIEHGIAAGMLTPAEIAADRANTSARVAADRATLPATARDAMKPSATVAMVTGAGDVFLSYDDPASAETHYTKALGMAGVDASKVALRLGMAQALQGKYAEAEGNFAKVTGQRATVARMWSGYVKSKLAGK